MLRILFGLYILLTFNLAYAQVSGCTDPNANNFDPSATSNDGSCSYSNTNFTPVFHAPVPATISETSGLMFWDGLLWTHNDSGGDAVLFGLDTASGTLVRSVRILEATNVDWEDITRDEDYVYIADFGNNNGTRTDLKIY